jgi:vancomycin resistance protein YoaR
MTSDSTTTTEPTTAITTEPTPALPVSRPTGRLRRMLQLVGVVVGVVVALVALEQLVFANRVLPGVDVDGVQAATKTAGGARAAIAARAEQLERDPIVVLIGDRQREIRPTDVDLRIDVDATVDAARDAGREDLSAWEIVTSPFQRLVVGDDVALSASWDDEKVRAVLAKLEEENVTGFEPGEVRFEGTNVVPVSPAVGSTVDADAAIAPLEAELASGDRRPVRLPTRPVEPVLSDADVQRVAEQARSVVSAPYEVVRGFTVMALAPEQIASALTTTRDPDGRNLSLAVDPSRLASTVGAAAEPFASAPVDARFVVNGGSVDIVPSQDGLALDFAALGTPIVAQQRRIEAPLAPVTPARNTAWAESLGIKELIGTFTTQHPCCAARVTNIHRAADLMQDRVLEPGQEFSLNEAVGPRTAARGFLEAPVYYRRPTTDFGGGVSQLSTTVYNAAWWAGLEILEHQPHSVWFSRYPAGREATLNYGTIDNRFRNNTQHGVLVHTSYTGTSITVSIYGDREGKVVREENRRVTSGTQAAGAPFTVEYERVIDQPGQPQVREHYRWRYQRSVG